MSGGFNFFITISSLSLLKHYTMARKNYSGSDLSQEFKSFYHKEKKRLMQLFDVFLCSKVEMSYGFYYFSGFFTADNGQIYYFSCDDVRHFGYERLMFRTAKDYKDYTGGTNQFVGTSYEELFMFFKTTMKK